MKHFFALTVILLSAFSARADIITCTFTEPFIDTVYSMARQELTVKDFEGGHTVLKNISFQIMGPGLFELRNRKGEVLQTLKLTNNGSDGMSDRIFPFEVQSSEKLQPWGANNGIGGCYSNFLKAQEGQP